MLRPTSAAGSRSVVSRIRRHARFDVGRLLAVEQHHVARQAEIAARPRHHHDGARACIGRRRAARAARRCTMSDERGNGER